MAFRLDEEIGHLGVAAEAQPLEVDLWEVDVDIRQLLEQLELHKLVLVDRLQHGAVALPVAAFGIQLQTVAELGVGSEEVADLPLDFPLLVLEGLPQDLQGLLGLFQSLLGPAAPQVEEQVAFGVRVGFSGGLGCLRRLDGGDVGGLVGLRGSLLGGGLAAQLEQVGPLDHDGLLAGVVLQQRGGLLGQGAGLLVLALGGEFAGSQRQLDGPLQQVGGGCVLLREGRSGHQGRQQQQAGAQKSSHRLPRESGLAVWDSGIGAGPAPGGTGLSRGSSSRRSANSRWRRPSTLASSSR